MERYYLAVDIGASSGRHMLGHVEDGKLILEEVYRFSNGAALKDGHLCWDVDALFAEILNGMRQCRSLGKIPVTMGVDTWAVDFVLLDSQGKRIGGAVSYRDGRTAGMADEVRRAVSDAELYARTGIQFQPFNTIYQLSAVRDLLPRAEKLLMLPDYFHCLLTGRAKFEYTNASSTGLINARSRDWDGELLDALGYPRRLFPPLSFPGETVGTLLPAVREAVGFDCTVVLPATHDTGSAFLAVPARDDRSICLSSGTWSLLGVETTAPITSEQSRRSNFTNEGGYGGTYRYLKNIMGLWMIQQLRRELAPERSFGQLMDLAERSDCGAIVDVNAPPFLAPDRMAEAIRAECRAHGRTVPGTDGELLACVYHSLALCYRDAVDELSGLTGKKYNAIHIVGGGSSADYLNRLTAKACGLPVYAGPTEGTALGNLIAQMIAAGEFETLSDARAAISNSFAIKEFLP